MKKKVLHVLFSSTYSGAENVACTIIENLNDNYDEYYCCPSGPIEIMLKQKSIVYIPIKKVSVKELKMVIEKLKPDIVHAHDVRVSCLLTFIKGDFEIISHIHGNHPFMRSFNYKSLLYNLCSGRFKHIFWVSESALDNYYFKKNIIEKSSVLYNIINPIDLLRKKDLDTLNYDVDIIFIGRLMEAKNPERLINIVEKVKRRKKDLKCYIVGDGKLREFVEKRIIDLNLEENIKLLGFLDNPYKILSCAKVMLMTSRHEGTPMVLLEAMALGVPVVSTPIDGIKVFINASNGFLSENDDELANECLKLIEDKKTRNKKSLNIRKKFNEINDINSYCNHIMKYYEL